MKQKLFQFLVSTTCIATSLMHILPVMSTYLSDGESCTLMVRGYNLMEFTSLSFIPMIAPLFIIVILFGHQSKSAQEIELLLLTTVNMVCYVHGVNAAKEWLYSLDGSLLEYYPGMLLLPFAFCLVVGCSVLTLRLTTLTTGTMEYASEDD